MKSTLPPAADQAQKLEFVAHRNVYWKGKRYHDEDPLEATEAETLVPPFSAWIAHGWVAPKDAPTPAAPAAPPPAKNGREQYEVLQVIQWHGDRHEPGAIIDFAVKGSHSNRDRWLKAGKIRKHEPVAAPAVAPDEDEVLELLGVPFNGQLQSVPSGAVWFIKRWGWDGKDAMRLYLVDRDIDPAQKGAKGFTAWWLDGCKKDAQSGLVVATGSKGEEFRVYPPLAPEPRASADLPTSAPIPQTVSAEIVQMIPWGRIKRSPFNPRQNFTSTPAAAASMRELIDSIRANGIIVPLIVRPASPLHPHGPHTSETVMYELVAGERRWTAADQAGLETLPCIVRDLAKQKAIEQQALENIAREDLNEIEEGQGYRTLMDEGGFTVPQISKRTGKSEATIYSRLKLLDCPPGVRQALIEKRLPASTADLIAREEDRDFQFACMDAIILGEPGQGEEDGRVLSFRQAKAWIAENRPRFLAEAAWKKRQRDSHVHKDAARVLTLLESNAALFSGGGIRLSQDYVKPDDQCFDDPEKRTFAQLAAAAGVELPKPILAADPADRRPVVLLPRGETETALAAIIPEAGAYKRRQAEAEAQRQREILEAERVRSERAMQRTLHARGTVERFRDWLPADWDAEAELWRFVVGTHLRTLLDADPDEFMAGVREFGVPDLADEDEANVDDAWIEEYLEGCDIGRLRAWAVFLALRGGNVDEWHLNDVDEDQLRHADQLLADPTEPQTLAVCDTDKSFPRR